VCVCCVCVLCVFFVCVCVCVNSKFCRNKRKNNCLLLNKYVQIALKQRVAMDYVHFE